MPVSLIALALTWWTLRDVPQERGKGRFDLLGTLLIVGALTGLVLGWARTSNSASSTTEFSDIGGLPPYAAPVLAAAAVMFVLFIVVEAARPRPAVRPAPLPAAQSLGGAG